MKSDFSFLVMSYNHEKYVVEHLESIKFLVEKYGKDLLVDLIVNDDASKDNTVALIEDWVKHNSGLFRNVIKFYNEINLGTCKSLLNMLSNDKSSRCKISAADDVYSFENLFQDTNHEKDVAIVSGYPLYLIENKLIRSKKSDLLMAGTQVVYKNDDLIRRFKHPAIHNAPSILYSEMCLKDKSTLDFLSRFSVIEDWPIQISIARKYPSHKFNLVNKVFVYYRKTAGSTLYVKKDKFDEDINLIYSDLIANEQSKLDRLRLNIRRFCYEERRLFFIKFLNIDYFIFILKLLSNIFQVILLYRSLKSNMTDHERHYNLIQLRTKLFFDNQ